MNDRFLAIAAMSYRLSPGKPLPKQLRRVLLDELEGTAREIRGLDGKHSSEAIHEARKHLKKARALVRLLRPATGDTFYRRENTGMRRIAQRLSPIRDAHVREQTLRKLVDAASHAGQKRVALTRIHGATVNELERVLASSNEGNWSKQAVADVERILGRIRKSSVRGIDTRFLCLGLEARVPEGPPGAEGRKTRTERRKPARAAQACQRRGIRPALAARRPTPDCQALGHWCGEAGGKARRLDDLAMIELMPGVSEAYTPSDWEGLKKVVVSRKSRAGARCAAPGHPTPRSKTESLFQVGRDALARRLNAQVDPDQVAFTTLDFTTSIAWLAFSLPSGLNTRSRRRL